MTHAYDQGEADTPAVYRRIHANSEQTHLLITQLDSEHWIAIAADVDPRDYSPGDGELIAYDPTRAGVEAKAEHWLTEHPKGIAGGGSGRLAGALQKIAAWGEQMNEQQQPPEDA